MNRLLSILIKRNTVITITVLVAILFLISMYNRFIYIDDAWFGEQAYWFSKLGYARTSTIIDYFGWSDRLFVFHKLNIIIGAALIDVFGWSVTPLRSATFVYYIVFLFVITKSLWNSNSYLASIKWYYVLFFIVVNPQTLLYAFTYRPEVLMMSLGFYSFILLSGKRTNFNVIFSGIFAGLAVLVHLNAAMYIVAGFFIILLQKQYLKSLIFAFSATIVASLYFIDLLSPGNFDAFLYQIMNWPDNITTNYSSNGIWGFIVGVLIKLSNEHQRFFWSPDVWGLSSIFVLSLMAKGKTLWKKYKELLIYIIIADVSLNIVGSHIAQVNMLLLLPFLSLVAAAYIGEIKQNSTQFVKLLTMLIIVFQVVMVVINFVDIINKRENTELLSKSILSNFPADSSRVLVPYRFVFNQLPNKNLISYKTIEYHQVKHGSKYSKKEFIDLASSLGINYLVISPEMYKNGEGMYPWISHEFGKSNNNKGFIVLKIDDNNNLIQMRLKDF